jgi:hypothetical protein
MKIETLNTRKIDGLTFGLREKLSEIKRTLNQVIAQQRVGGAAEKEFFQEMAMEAAEIRALLDLIDQKAVGAEEVSKAFSGGK